jgi:hypothetical protein
MEELALLDNPFDPRWLSGEDPRYLQNLSLDPLRIDECEDISSLYFTGFPNMAAHETVWRQKLKVRGYQPGGKRPLASLAAVVRGNRGSGKTTLASSFLRYLKTCRAEGETEWTSIQHIFRDVDMQHLPLSSEEICGGCAKIAADLDAVSPRSWVCALIDNADDAALNRVLEVFRDKNHCPHVFVITTDHIEVIDKAQLIGYPVKPLDFPLKPLEPDDAVAYARFRIEHFRHPEHADEYLCDKMFPLLEVAVRRWNTRMAGAAADVGNTLYIRNLNTDLSDRIDKLSEQFAQPDISELPPPRRVNRELLQRLLDALD